MKPILAVQHVTRRFGSGGTQVMAVKDISLTVAPGEVVLIMGPSGSGKTTLLMMLGGLLKPSEGQIYIGSDELSGMNEQRLPEVRLRRIGFIFQDFNLLSALSCLDNVAIVAQLAGLSRQQARAQAGQLLEQLGLGRRLNFLPEKLSGGEKQRVAIARALINNPALLLADEPTGNLDQATGDSIITLFEQLNRDGLTIVVVTHNPTLARTACRQVELSDGRLVTPCGLQNNHTRCHSDET